MNKKILSGAVALAIGAVAAVNVNIGSKTGDMSDVMLSNVEALAQGETPFSKRQDRWNDYCVYQCMDESESNCTYYDNDPFQC